MSDGRGASPVPRPVREELERLGDRWRALPVAQAGLHAARLHALAQALADQVAARAGSRRAVVPDLGPAVALDQVAVLVYDAASAGLADGLPEHLRELRRFLL